jgi:hypothetical protein
MINALDHEPRGDIIFKAAYEGRLPKRSIWINKTNLVPVVFSREPEESQQPTFVPSSAEETNIFDWVNELVQSSTVIAETLPTAWSAVNRPHLHGHQDQLVNSTRASISDSRPKATRKGKATQNDQDQERVVKRETATRSTVARSTALKNASVVPVKRPSKKDPRTSTWPSASARKTPRNKSTLSKTTSGLKPSSTSARVTSASVSSESPRRSTRVQAVPSTQQNGQSSGGIDDLLWASEVLAGMETPMPE